LEGGVAASGESGNRDPGTSSAEQVRELSKQLLLSSTKSAPAICIGRSGFGWRSTCCPTIAKARDETKLRLEDAGL
jgi:hypothetical protein